MRKLAIAGLALLAACAAPEKAPTQPNVNLSGYPPAFREGYMDGCASARGSTKRNAERFKSDVQYA